MKAKIILNEIKRGENSALGSIGIGSANFNHGFKFIRSDFSFWNPIEKNIPFESSIRSLILLGMKRWAYGGTDESILVIEDVSCPMTLTGWIEGMTRSSQSEKRYIKTTFEGKKYALRQRYSKEWNVGEVNVNYEQDKLIVMDNYYLIKYR